MNHPIAQLVALACHANAVLQGRPVPQFLLTNSICRFCDSVDLVRLKRGWLTRPKESPLAANPNAWFDHLKRSGCDTVRVHHNAQPGISDRILAAFIGGSGRWLLEAKSSGASDYYEARWTVWNQNAPEQRIWRVTYVLIAEARHASSLPLSPIPDC